MSRALSWTLFALLALVVVVSGSIFIVAQTEQALVLKFGAPVRVIQKPGLHFKVPFVENVEFYDARLLDFDAEPKAVIAADQKRLIVDAFVRYRITDPLRFKQTVADERTMRSRMNAILESSLRQTVGSVPLSALVSERRAGIMKQIRDLVNAQARGAIPVEGAPENTQGFGIEVVDVRIRRTDLPPENSESIYKRMQAEREREAKEFRAQGAEEAQKIRAMADKERTILLAEARKEADITRGEGDREATRIFGAAVGQDAEFYQFYRSLQAYRKTLSGKDTTLVISPEMDFLRFLDKGGQ